MTLAPILLFVYDRPYHTKQTVEALQKNEFSSESELFIYSDAPKNEEVQESVAEVRAYIKQIDGFKKVTIIEREKNRGLANSIIDGVTKIVNEYGKVIVLEDDLVTSPFFLRFMNDALVFYESNKQVWSITGFTYPLKIKNYAFSTYLYERASSKSWAIWKDAWNKIEFREDKIIEKYHLDSLALHLLPYGKDLYKMFLYQLDKKINSWGIRFTINQIMENKYTVYPCCSFVKDIGDDIGTHAKRSLSHKVQLCNIYERCFTLTYDLHIAKAYQRYLQTYFFVSKLYAFKNKLYRLMGVKV